MSQHRDVKAIARVAMLAVLIAGPVVAQTNVKILQTNVNTVRADPVPAFEPIRKAIAKELSGQRGFATTAFVEQFYRLPGNRGFDASIDTVARLLEKAGYLLESNAGPNDRFTYRIESQPLGRNALAWSPLGASVNIVGDKAPVLEWKTNHNMLASNSYSTPAGGVTAELVNVGAGADADFAKVDVKGKIVMSTLALRNLVTKAYAAGAIGAMATQRLPAYNEQERNTTAIGFSGITLDSVHHAWGIFLSKAAYDRLTAALAKGAVQLKVDISTALESRPERSLVAEIRGSTVPTERVVYSAHVQEPGANDNASGVGALAEMARVAVLMVKNKSADPGRTITFLWGNEISWTARFLAQDAVRRAGVKFGMSLDMVGENTAITKGTFLIEKMKDPSWVWVRGEDQHTAWGAGRPPVISEIIPHWFNDFVRQRCLAEAAGTTWVVKANPFEGGSDHTPFLDAKIPGLLFWHFTDQYYHTDLDRLNAVSATTMQHVGNCALSAGLILATGSEEYTRAALKELTQVAEHEMKVQGALSRAALATPTRDLAKEQLILNTWRDYYVGAIAKIPDLMIIKPFDMTAVLTAAQERVKSVAATELATLK